MKYALFCAWLLAFLGGAVAAQEPDAFIWDRKLYDKAYKLGVAEADEQLKAGNATIYTFGLCMSLEMLDRQTGLPIQPIADSVIVDSFVGRVAGHNHRIDEVIAERGLPSNSFKRWDKELFDLKGFYETRSKTEKPVRLLIGRPAARSPDGKYTLRLVKTELQGDNGKRIDTKSVVVNVAGVDRDPLWLYVEGNHDFFWGPKESGFAVIRSKGERMTAFEALDLKRGTGLRDEFDNLRPSDL